MRILFFMESLHGGGKERRSVELIKYLRHESSDYKIEVVLTEEEIYYEDIFSAGVNIRILKRKTLKYDPGIFFRFYSICQRFRPDIIHAWGKMTTFYSIPVRILTGIPLVSSLIADSSKNYGSLSPYNFLLKTNIYFSDKVLSNSRAGLKAYGITGGKAKVIYNGADLSRFRKDFDKDEVKREFGIKAPLMIVMVASFSRFKDYDLFIDLAREMQGIRKDVCFVAVGDGPHFNRISRRIKNEKIKNTFLTGRQSNAERIISASDIGILCTWREGLSNSILEYMALGKPAIATDLSGGSRELIEDGITGYCTNRDLSAVTGLLNRLLNDNELRLTMGQKGRERIEKKFSIERMGAEFKELYEEVLSGKKSEKNITR